MGKWRSRLFSIIGVLLILVGVFFLFKPQIDHFITGKQNDEKSNNMISNKQTIKPNIKQHQKCQRINRN